MSKSRMKRLRTCVAAGSNSSSTSPSDCSSNNESCTAIGNGTDQTTELEDGNGEEKGPFEWKIFISLFRLAHGQAWR
jgi:hypothetical protein